MGTVGSPGHELGGPTRAPGEPVKQAETSGDAQNKNKNKNKKATDMTYLELNNGTEQGGISSIADDAAAMKAVVKRAFDEFFENVRQGGPMNPSPELLRLLREASVVIAQGDPRRRAELSLLTGLIHEFAHDIDGAEACYAEAAEADPNVLKRGVLANIHRMSIRQRGRNAAVVASSTKAISTGSMAPGGRARGRHTTRPARPRSGTGA